MKSVNPRKSNTGKDAGKGMHKGGPGRVVSKYQQKEGDEQAGISCMHKGGAGDIATKRNFTSV